MWHWLLVTSFKKKSVQLFIFNFLGGWSCPRQKPKPPLSVSSDTNKLSSTSSKGARVCERERVRRGSEKGERERERVKTTDRPVNSESGREKNYVWVHMWVEEREGGEERRERGGGLLEFLLLEMCENHLEFNWNKNRVVAILSGSNVERTLELTEEEEEEELQWTLLLLI
jgi:hypothetical protein